ncbi:hypothetical protein F4782DRAFT_330283 [Xylaria castorea]|nr:hypothetical protein F4782DRAFT_330283 [Xylaria castorea]
MSAPECMLIEFFSLNVPTMLVVVLGAAFQECVVEAINSSRTTLIVSTREEGLGKVPKPRHLGILHVARPTSAEYCYRATTLHAIKRTVLRRDPHTKYNSPLSRGSPQTLKNSSK